MWWKKVLKYIYGNGSYGGNKGVLPEENVSTSPIKSQPKTLGEELHEIATPIHEEYKEKLKKLREIREDQYNHYAEIVFNNIKEQLLKRANAGFFRDSILDEDIKNMLRDEGFGGVDIDDLVEALNKLGTTIGIGVELKTYTTYHLDEDGERKEDGYKTWVIFKW